MSKRRARSARVMIAGGKETRAQIMSVRGRTATGGLYTTRGPLLEVHGVAYKPYNEDGGAVGVIAKSRTKRGTEIVYAGAFDQAGGMGQVPGLLGEASRQMAEAFCDAVEQVAGDPQLDPVTHMHQAVLRIHDGINALNSQHGVDAMTTACCGALIGKHLYVVNAGDSKAYLFDKGGKLKAETKAHNLGDEAAAETGDPNAGLHLSNIITSGVGGGADVPKVDGYTWEVEEGDRILFVSDGVSDANLEAQQKALREKPWDTHHGDVTARQLEELVGPLSTGAGLANEVSRWALRKMTARDAKPDNITVAALVVG